MARRRRFPSGSVCKPCWELKYCPYGGLVEFFPSPEPLRSQDQVEAEYRHVLNELTAGNAKTEDDVWDAIEQLLYLRPDETEYIRQFDSKEVGCKVWGHACPVFFVQSGATETKESRKGGRVVPREIMLKVVRRDNQVCQVCHQYVPDTEVEFDHVIPFSKGGPTSADNIRLLHRACNRKKSDSLADILAD